MPNIDFKTVTGFGDEWKRFDQSKLAEKEIWERFQQYFKIFPWSIIPINASGFDMGCGTGRWARFVAPRVGKLHCIDPSSAIQIAQRNLADHSNCEFHFAGVDDQILPDGSMDFGYSLGVLHHIPDTAKGLRDCVRMLKTGAPFLVYLYYSLDNRSLAYRLLWRASNLLRKIISKMPSDIRFLISQFIATVIYLPLSRFAALMEFLGCSRNWACSLPLGYYRNLSFYTMRTDALDRFGTRLEQRFSRKEIQSMMELAGLKDITFSESPPYWCAVGIKA